MVEPQALELKRPAAAAARAHDDDYYKSESKNDNKYNFLEHDVAAIHAQLDNIAHRQSEMEKKLVHGTDTVTALEKKLQNLDRSKQKTDQIVGYVRKVKSSFKKPQETIPFHEVMR